jgi:hypothetical protein
VINVKNIKWRNIVIHWQLKENLYLSSSIFYTNSISIVSYEVVRFANVRLYTFERKLAGFLPQKFNHCGD